MEINKPGGFLLFIMEKCAEISDQEMIEVEEIERKVQSLNNRGVITYDFRKGFNGDLTSDELYDDLVHFSDVGWVETDFSNPHCRLTDKGKRIIKKFEIPKDVQEDFNNIFY